MEMVKSKRKLTNSVTSLIKVEQIMLKIVNDLEINQALLKQSTSTTSSSNSVNGDDEDDLSCKEIEDYLKYYENNKLVFNEERRLLIENIVKPTLKRDDIFFDKDTYYKCLRFVERWYYKLFPISKVSICLCIHV